MFNLSAHDKDICSHEKSFGCEKNLILVLHVKSEKVFGGLRREMVSLIRFQFYQCMY